MICSVLYRFLGITSAPSVSLFSHSRWPKLPRSGQRPATRINQAREELTHDATATPVALALAGIVYDSVFDDTGEGIKKRMEKAKADVEGAVIGATFGFLAGGPVGAFGRLLVGAIVGSTCFGDQP